MDERITAKTVTFTYSFDLRGVGGRQAAGAYLVESTEERLETMLFPAFRRKSTVIHVPGLPGTTRIVAIDPDDLERALEKDRKAEQLGARRKEYTL
jgi:hypothetical protein